MSDVLRGRRPHPPGPRGLGPRSWLLALILLLAVLASFGIGAYPLGFGRALTILVHAVTSWSYPSSWDLREITAVTVIRPPRILVATLAGIGLSLAGAALQGMMRNPLVGPDLIGVTSGAALGGVIGVEFGLPSIGIVALAFIGGLLAMAATFGLAGLARVRSDGVALILAGFFVGAFFLGVVGLILYLDPHGAGPMIVYWLLGSFRGADPTKLWTIAVPTLIGGAVLMGLRWRINLLSLGDMDAAALGIDVKRLRWIILAVVSLMVAAQVSVSGIVGWVGLVMPHCARMIVGPDHRRLLPVSGLLGGLFTLLLDDFTRTVVHAEIPAGLLTAFIGTPLICLLFWKVKTRGWIND